MPQETMYKTHTYYKSDGHPTWIFCFLTNCGATEPSFCQLAGMIQLDPHGSGTIFGGQKKHDIWHRI